MGISQTPGQRKLLMTIKKVYLFSSLLSLALAGRISYKDDGPRETARRPVRDEEPGRVQVLDCYDNYQGSGAQFHADDYVPSLRNYGWDNRIGSCCFTGIWILYGEDDYNDYSTGAASWWAFGENNCMDVPSQFNNDASSLRFTGAPDDYLYDTLNIYFNDYFIGNEEFMYNDMPLLNYDNRARSIIVTGCSPWTLYRYDNYQGRCRVLGRDVMQGRRYSHSTTVQARWKEMEHQVSSLVICRVYHGHG